MNVVIVSCFYQPRESSRTKIVKDYFDSLGYTSTIISSDFSHQKRAYQKIDEISVIQIHVPRYKNNLSIKRIISHVIFAYKLKSLLKRQKNISLLYVLAPPNLSSYLAIRYAKKKNIRSILDVIDIWPNTNINQFDKFGVLKCWHNYRVKSANLATHVILQSIAYLDFTIQNRDYTVLNLARRPWLMNIDEKSDDILRFVYLGAISEIYDFYSMIEILKHINKCELYIIGDGELKKELLEELTVNKIKFTDFGIIYDEKIKNTIINKCDFGFNCFKQDLIIGQSFKSLDYMAVGVPIINSLKYDTWNIVEKYNAGINYSTKDLESAYNTINNFSRNDLLQLRKNTRNAFMNEFSIETYQRKMSEIMNSWKEVK